MQTTSPPDTIPRSPGAEGRHWTPIVTVVATIAVAAAAFWWFGIRDSSSGPEPASFTFTESCIDFAGLTESGEVYATCVFTETSDPRWVGDSIITFSATERYGTYELTNDRGTWEGTWEARDAGTRVEGVGRGTGDYEGLQYRYAGFVTWPRNSFSGTIEPIP